MSVDYLIEIFGGTGAVVLGIATCIWGFCKTHEFKWDYDAVSYTHLTLPTILLV